MISLPVRDFRWHLFVGVTILDTATGFTSGRFVPGKPRRFRPHGAWEVCSASHHAVRGAVRPAGLSCCSVALK
ncbi:hypothetical protein S1001342_00917 [Acetobacter pasteurianus subsp. pasteurianus]|uniref:Uncharacterized protein n=1 Tax=Acetobacter pasteurianus subsp. pasteurianus TaxID=481145 RepID=A0A1Y0Y8D6_ACEPA|nr:hypothetical protein S1001342_00917 [Acetobacter pasteurianus subsp. pasteurianus]